MLSAGDVRIAPFVCLLAENARHDFGALSRSFTRFRTRCADQQFASWVLGYGCWLAGRDLLHEQWSRHGWGCVL